MSSAKLVMWCSGNKAGESNVWLVISTGSFEKTFKTISIQALPIF